MWHMLSMAGYKQLVPINRRQTQAVPKRWLTNAIRCVTSQKTEDLIYIAAEGWSHS